MSVRNLLARLADIAGGYERIACPHPGCRMSIRFRGVSAVEAQRYRALMSDHIKTHSA